MAMESSDAKTLTSDEVRAVVQATLGEHLRLQRKGARLTQRRLAKRMSSQGLAADPARISEYECGHKAMSEIQVMTYLACCGEDIESVQSRKAFALRRLGAVICEIPDLYRDDETVMGAMQRSNLALANASMNAATSNDIDQLTRTILLQLANIMSRHGEDEEDDE